MSTHTTMIIHNGIPLEVEFETEGDGGGPSYSPAYGADSGDPLVIIIRDAWSEEYGPATLNAQDDDEIVSDICANFEFVDYDFYDEVGGG